MIQITKISNMNLRLSFFLPLVSVSLFNAHAGEVLVGDATAALGPDFFFDTAVIGGGDTPVSSEVVTVRDFGIGGYRFNPAGTEVTITGIGWASPGNGVQATVATITIVSLGDDDVFNTGDDVVIGSTEVTIPANSSAGERYVVFDSPMKAQVTGSSTRFRIQISGDAQIRMKTTSGGSVANAKLSVAGSYDSDPLTDGDGDGIPDLYETETGVFVSPFDTGTNPAEADSDSDGLDDGDEFLIYQTNPNLSDADGDGLEDGDEVLVHFTNPANRDTDNDGLNDGQEVALGLDPLLRSDFDGDGFLDAHEVLFYGTDPKDINRFPGDGVNPGPGNFTPIVDSQRFNIVDNAVDLLGPVLINEAATGGNVDADFGTGVTSFALHYDDLFPAPGSLVTLTGFAWPVVAATNQSGDVLVQFFDPGPDGEIRNIDQARLVGSAKGSLTIPTSSAVMYWNFPMPIIFTSSGRGLIVKIQSTAALRIKAQDQDPNVFGTGVWYFNDGRVAFSGNRTSRISLGGTAVEAGPPVPEIVSVTRTGTTTVVTWDLQGAPEATLWRSTDLVEFTEVAGKIQTTETRHEEESTDPRVFFRLSAP